MTIEKEFIFDFNNFIITDFSNDAENLQTIFNNKDTLKFSFIKPTLRFNILKLDDNKYKNILSNFIIFDKNYSENNNEWKLIQKIDIEFCSLLILNEPAIEIESLDTWLQKCISSKELYNFEQDKIYLTSGFGPGIYKLMGVYDDSNKIIALKMEFVKEDNKDI